MNRRTPKLEFVATGDQLATALDQWLFFLKNGQELDAGNRNDWLSQQSTAKPVL